MDEKIFGNIGNSIKVIAKILFYLCLSIGLLTLIIGVFRFLGGVDEYTSFAEGMACTLEDAIEYDALYADCYYGRQTTKAGFILVLSSISLLPLYGFGELINLCSQINMKIKKDKDE